MEETLNQKGMGVMRLHGWLLLILLAAIFLRFYDIAERTVWVKVG